ncbi:MAG: TetR/AcrR family transcriptional regulator [Porticoccaceae bacterium]|nr:TetR/AcrR family transcriptional regulator [Porticoccaceae bacterium]
MKNTTSRTITEKTKGVRQGTATRRAGKVTASKIIVAAKEVLEQEDVSRFTMRNVAERAEISLANVQYYYKTRGDLIEALFVEIEKIYQQAYDHHLLTVGTSPTERFKAVLNFNFNEITSSKTRRFFVQLWAVIGSLDDFSGAKFGQLYAIDIAQLSFHISALVPDESQEEVNRRATLLAAVIEGLMIVGGEQDRSSPRTRSLLKSAEALAFRIALGDQAFFPEAEPSGKVLVSGCEAS